MKSANVMLPFSAICFRISSSGLGSIDLFQALRPPRSKVEKEVEINSIFIRSYKGTKRRAPILRIPPFFMYRWLFLKGYEVVVERACRARLCDPSRSHPEPWIEFLNSDRTPQCLHTP